MSPKPTSPNPKPQTVNLEAKLQSPFFCCFCQLPKKKTESARGRGFSFSPGLSLCSFLRIPSFAPRRLRSSAKPFKSPWAKSESKRAKRREGREPLRGAGWNLGSNPVELRGMDSVFVFRESSQAEHGREMESLFLLFSMKKVRRSSFNS